MTNPIPLAELRDAVWNGDIGSEYQQKIEELLQAIFDAEPMKWCRVHRQPRTGNEKGKPRCQAYFMWGRMDCDITTIVPVEVKTDD